MKGIITLCGSTKFPEVFAEVNSALTKADWAVFSVGTFVRSEFHDRTKPEHVALKQQLDKLHKDKIMISQAVVILNRDGYVGTSTKSELDWARKLGKHIYWYDMPKSFEMRISVREDDWKELL